MMVEKDGLFGKYKDFVAEPDWREQVWQLHQQRWAELSELLGDRERLLKLEFQLQKVRAFEDAAVRWHQGDLWIDPEKPEKYRTLDLVREYGEFHQFRAE